MTRHSRPRRLAGAIAVMVFVWSLYAYVYGTVLA
jgi:hypothetical protein